MYTHSFTDEHLFPASLCSPVVTFPSLIMKGLQTPELLPLPFSYLIGLSRPYGNDIKAGEHQWAHVLQNRPLASINRARGRAKASMGAGGEYAENRDERSDPRCDEDMALSWK